MHTYYEVPWNTIGLTFSKLAQDCTLIRNYGTCPEAMTTDFSAIFMNVSIATQCQDQVKIVFGCANLPMLEGIHG